MRRATQLAKFGRFTSGPANIHGSVDVGVCLIVAGTAPKQLLASAVFLRAISTHGAGSARVAGIDRHDDNSRHSGLVLQEKAQLRKRPGMQNNTLLLQGLNPFTNSAKFFDGDPATGAFSFSNDLLGNTVVDVRREAPLTSRKASEPALGGARPFFLELGAQPPVAMADGINLASRIPSTIGSASNVHDTKVYAEKTSRLHWGGIRQVNRAVQEEPAFAIDEIGLAPDVVEPLLLVLAVDQRRCYPAFHQCPQTDLVGALETHNALVICDGAVALENRTDFPIAREALDRFADRTHRHLGRQTKRRADIPVNQPVNRRLTEYARLKGFARRKRGGFVDALQGSQKTGSLFCVRQNLQLDNQFHHFEKYHSVTRNSSRPTCTANSFAQQLKRVYGG